jgi:hypothetical protein
MSSWSVQLLTILGVAVGAMASFISARLLDRERWRREEILRWDTTRLESYMDFAVAVKKQNEIARRICAGLGLPASLQPLEQAEGLKLLAETNHELEVKFEPVLMLGTPEAINAAQAWRHSAWHLEWLARGMRNDPEEYRRATDATREARKHYYSAIRADIGVTSGPIPDVGGRTAWVDNQTEWAAEDQAVLRASHAIPNESATSPRSASVPSDADQQRQTMQSNEH